MKVDILGVKIDGVTMTEALARIEGFLKDGKFHYVVTPNPEIVIFAQKDKNFAKILNQADLAIPDGVGLVWASKILSSQLTPRRQSYGASATVQSTRKNKTAKREPTTLKQRVTGVDLADEICKMASEKGFTMGFLGGKSNVAVRAAKCQKERYPGIKVLFAGPGDPKKPLIVNPQLPIDILLVAYGFPKQEYWMAKWGPKSSIKVAVGIGGTLDYFASQVTRAPKFLRNLGLEWLWRLIRQPWRIERQLALAIFVFSVLKQKLK